MDVAGVEVGGLQWRRLSFSRLRRRGCRWVPSLHSSVNPADPFIGRNCVAIAKGQG